MANQGHQKGSILLTIMEKYARRRIYDSVINMLYFCSQADIQMQLPVRVQIFSIVCVECLSIVVTGPGS